MKVEAVDFFYLSMPEITTNSDGRRRPDCGVCAGGLTGWGECEASPLVSIAAYVTPMSHGVCRPVSASVLGQTLNSPGDISRMAAKVSYNSMDLLQAPHLVGIEIALWDLLGKARGQPIFRLLGYERAHARDSLCVATVRQHRAGNSGACPRRTSAGFRAMKFGWGPFCAQAVEADVEHLDAAREGLGAEGILLVDAGQVWIDDVEAAAARLPALERNRVTWLEEPFHAGALGAYATLGARTNAVKWPAARPRMTATWPSI